MTLSVEIDQGTGGGLNSMREIQSLIINQTIVREQSRITILNPDGGQYTLKLLVPATKTYYYTGSIKTTATKNEMYEAIRGFYSTNYAA